MLQMHKEEGFNIILDTANKKTFTLDLDYPKCLSVLNLT